MSVIVCDAGPIIHLYGATRELGKTVIKPAVVEIGMTAAATSV